MLTVTSYQIAKLVLSGNVVLIKVYTNDLAPRSDYSALYKYCELVSRCVGCGVPFLLYLNYQYTVYWYIYAVAGGSVLLSTIFLLPLPETRGRAKPENVDQFISLFYGSRFRPSNQRYPNGHVITPVAVTPATVNAKVAADNVYPTSKAEELVEPAQEASTSRSWSGKNSRHGKQTPNHVPDSSHVPQHKNKGAQQEYDLSLLSNTDVGNLSLYDPDIHKLKKLSPNLESTRLSEISGSRPRELVRPKSLNLQRRNNRPVISRNPSYESSLNDTSTIMSATPDTSCHLVTPDNGHLVTPDNGHLVTPGNTDFQNNEILKRNSLVAFTPKSSVRKDFFSLSRV